MPALQLLAMALTVVFVLGVWVFIMFTLVVLVPPNRIAVLSGRKHTTPDGRTVGYRIVEGRQMRLPVIEALDYLPELPSIVSAELAGVHFKNNETGSFAASATVRYATGSAQHHAVERFLGQRIEAVQRVIVTLLEGHMREVAATLTRDRVTQDPAQAADALRAVLAGSLDKLGLEIMTVTLGRSESSPDTFADQMREAGMLDIATTTELACDVAGEQEPKLDDDALAAAGQPHVAFASGRITLRWASAQVSPHQLIAGARALAAVRQDRGAYR
jgi:flotillin